jgi:hypothetical protein
MDVVGDFQQGAARLRVLHHAAEQAVSGAWVAAGLPRAQKSVEAGRVQRRCAATDAGARTRRAVRSTSDPACAARLETTTAVPSALERPFRLDR